MKLFLVARQSPGKIDVRTKESNGRLLVEARLNNLKMPWPVTISLMSPDGREIYKIDRATIAKGWHVEEFPIGLNAKPGDYWCA